MANSTSKCCGCKQRYPSASMIRLPAGKFHSLECAIDYANKKQRKQAELQKKRARAEHRERKQAVKSLSQLKSEAQAAVNRYIRLRDEHLGCVSCDKPATWTGQWHASHFHPQGRSSRLRFNTYNVHKSCSVCNNHLSGNLVNYEPELIRRIGRKKFYELAAMANETIRYDADYLMRIKCIFNKKYRVIKKIRAAKNM